MSPSPYHPTFNGMGWKGLFASPRPSPNMVSCFPFFLFKCTVLSLKGENKHKFRFWYNFFNFETKCMRMCIMLLDPYVCERGAVKGRTDPTLFFDSYIVL